jgi:hypothetical protein
MTESYGGTFVNRSSINGHRSIGLNIERHIDHNKSHHLLHIRLSVSTLSLNFCLHKTSPSFPINITSKNILKHGFSHLFLTFIFSHFCSHSILPV